MAAEAGILVVGMGGGCPGDKCAEVSQRTGIGRGDHSCVTLSCLSVLSSSPDSSQTLSSVLGVCLPLSVNLRELVSGQLHHDADIIPFVYCQEGEGETDCLPWFMLSKSVFHL